MTELWIIDKNGTKTVLTLGGPKMETQKLLQILDKHIDQQGLAKDLAVELVLPLIEKFVADTANPYDDTLVKYLKEYLSKLEV